jgi:hypothetical protein
MPQCPQCNKPLRELVRNCPSCKADLDLLVDYVSHLQGGLERAEELTKAGELGRAVWAYLEILEVDPDNAAAKKQVAQVAAAVRQFDITAPGRAWINPGKGSSGGSKRPWQFYLGMSALIVAAFVFGITLGSLSLDTTDHVKADEQPAPPMKNTNSLSGK